MSSNSQVLNTGQQAITNYDTSKLLIGNNRFTSADYTNDAYDPVTLKMGTVMGRVTGTNEVVPMKSTASDGSQYPRFILIQDITVAAGDTVNLALCYAGEINQNEVILDREADTLSTVVDGATIFDRIGSDSVGIVLENSTEMTKTDNQ